MNTYHDKETHSDGLADLDEFALIGCCITRINTNEAEQLEIEMSFK